MGYLPNVQFQPYVKPYVGSANQELAQTVKVLTQRYDENLDSSTKLGILAGLAESEVPEGDREYVRGTVSQIQESLKGLATSEETYYAARPKIAQLATKFMGDPDIAKMKENKKLMDEAARVRNDMTAKGFKVLDFSQGQQFKSVTVDEKGNKIYNTYKPADEMMHNYHDAQAKFFDQMQADGSSGGLTKAAIDGFLKTGSWQGISGAKIQAQANRALFNYLQTPEGNQQLRNYTQLQGMSPQQAQHAILKEMISTGMERQFSVSQTNYQQDPMAVAAARATGKEPKLDGFNLEREADVKVSNAKNVEPVLNFFTDAKKHRYSDLKPEQKDIVQNSIAQAKQRLGEGASKTAIAKVAKQIAGKYAELNVAPAYYAITKTEDINNAKSYFKNNYNSRLYIDPENSGKSLNWQQLKESLDMEDEDDSKVLDMINVSGYYHPDHPFTKGLSGEAKNKFIQPTRLSFGLPDGKTKTIVAGSDLGSTQAPAFGYEKLKHEIYTGQSTGRGKAIRLNGKRYQVIPTGQASQYVEGDEDVTLVDMETGKKELVPITTLYKARID